MVREWERKQEGGVGEQRKANRLNSASSEKAAASANEPYDASNASRLESDYS